MAAQGTKHTRNTLILVVDDDPFIREFLTCLLEDEGYCVAQAVDGRDALRVACETPPALVLSDVMMPSLDGYGLSNCLQRHPELHAVPIFLTTAAISPHRGTVPLVRKPFDIDQLMAMITSALAGRPAHHYGGFARV